MIRYPLLASAATSLLLGVLLAVPPRAGATPPRHYEDRRPLAPEGRDDDRFGQAIALDEGRLLSGAPRTDRLGMDSGAAGIFRFDPAVLDWTPEALLLAPDGATDDRFGAAVALDDPLAVVGAWKDDDLGDSSGSAWVFRRDEDTNTWTPTTKLLAPDGERGDGFGLWISIDADTAVIGAPQARSGAGTVYVFERDPVTDDWNEEAILQPDEPGADARFGRAVAVRGDTIVIGGLRYPNPDGSTGRGWIFRRDGAGEPWTQRAVLRSPDAAPGDVFGVAVDIDPAASTVIVGDLYARNRLGAGYLFTEHPDTGAWNASGIVLGSDEPRNDAFGLTVALDADHAAAGAERGRVEPGFAPGAVYTFQRREIETGPRLAVSDPLPEPGEIVRFEVTSDRPDTPTWLGFGAASPGRTFVDALDVTLSLVGPRLIDSPRRTDAAGTVAWEITVDPRLAGRSLLFQAVQPGFDGNVVAVEVGP